MNKNEKKPIKEESDKEKIIKTEKIVKKVKKLKKI